MDTKSKGFRRSAATKTLAFFAACLSLCAIVYLGMSFVYRSSGGERLFEDTLEAVVQPEYAASLAHTREIGQVVWRLREAALSGNLPPTDLHYLEGRVFYYAVNQPEAQDSVKDSGQGPAEAEAARPLKGAGPTVLANTDMTSPEQFQAASPYYYFYEKGQPVAVYGGARYTPELASADTGLSLYVAFKPDYMAARQAEWLGLRSAMTPVLILAAACLLLGLLATVYLSAVAGRRPESEALYPSPLDHIYSDLLFTVMGCFVVAWVGAMAMLASEIAGGGSSAAASIWFAVAVSALCAPCVLALWLSAMRKIKGGLLLRHSLIYATMSGCFRLIRGVFRMIGRFFGGLFSGRRFEGYPFARALFKRQARFIAFSFCLVAGFFFFSVAVYDAFWMALACLAAELVLIYHYVGANNATFEDMERVSTQVYEIYQGHMEYDPGVAPGSQLHATSRQLLDIGGGMHKALERQLQSERMKIALVTNVSHDLKTPLTSIIGYIDLLSRDEALSPEARDYVAILTQKSQRLKSIIEDLFDLAKTTSGDVSGLSIEVLDLRRLIEQTLADMEDKIERSGQIIRKALPEAPAFIRADGRKLYRVIQNIVDNALKYSMPGTRIFVTLACSPAQARLTFKNTASYEMNFTAEEMLERFARGDKSRTTEGSGLGLSIAEGFTRALGGTLQVGVDGDQFRVDLTFDTAAPPAAGADAEAAPAAGEPLPTGLQARMAVLRGKLYQPQAGAPARPIAPAEPFEPERPVELAELESALQALEPSCWEAECPAAARPERDEAAPPEAEAEEPETSDVP